MCAKSGCCAHRDRNPRTSARSTRTCPPYVTQSSGMTDVLGFRITRSPSPMWRTVYNLEEEKNQCGANSKPTTGMEANVIEVGQVFGRLTVVAWRGGKSSLWQCRCICGTEKVVRASSLRGGNTRSCGCLLREIRDQQTAHQVKPGQVFGRLTVVAAERRENYETSWRCLCICGGETEVRESSLRGRQYQVVRLPIPSKSDRISQATDRVSSQRRLKELLDAPPDAVAADAARAES
jgi:hypothetical protein